jgi:hypothetical protein
MQALQYMAFQQKSVRIIIIFCANAECTLLAEFEITRIVTQARFRNKGPPETFHGGGVLRISSGLPLQPLYLAIDFFISFMWSERNSAWSAIGSRNERSISARTGRAALLHLEVRFPETDS